MKTSSFSRTFELLKIASKVGLKEAMSGNLKSRIDQAIIIAEGLSNLKGAAMKAGQLLSLELADYFPKEAVDVISKLNSNASFVEFSTIEKIIKNELGPNKEGYKSRIITAGGTLRLSIRLYLEKNVDRGIFSCNKLVINTKEIRTRVFSCIVIDKQESNYSEYDYRIFSKLIKTS